MKKICVSIKNLYLLPCFLFVIAKVLLIGAAVYFDGLFTVSLSGNFFFAFV